MKQHLFTLAFFFLGLSAFAQLSPPLPNRAEELNKKYTSGLFSYPDAVYFDMENDAGAAGALGYLNVLDWLQGRVAGLHIYTIRNTSVPFIRNRPAAIYVDEIRVDPGYLAMLPVADIGMIKVMKTPVALFWGAQGGAIAIYTRHGDEEDKEAKP